MKKLLATNAAAIGIAMGALAGTVDLAKVEYSTHNKVQLWENGPYWAETNIGAENPWDSGYYFWWGDTIGYKWENDAWVASDGSSSGFSFSGGNAPTYGTDTATLQSEGWITEDGVLAPNHDAAQVQWGGGWRMPTVQELNDLCYNKCVWIWTTTNGVNGYLVRGKDEYSSASIFLPCTGYGSGNSGTAFSSHGYYWSSVPASWNTAGGIVYLSYRSNIEYSSVRYAGTPIRPVQDGEGEPPTPCYEMLNASDITAPYAAPKAVKLYGAVYDGCDVVGIVELKLGKVNVKKGDGKVSGTVTTIDGKKHSAKAVAISDIDGTSPKSVSLDVKDLGAMELVIGGEEFAGSLGDWHVQSAAVGGAWNGSGVAVTVDAADLSMFTGTVLTDLLPANVTASVSRGKWTFAKAAGVKWAKPKKGMELKDLPIYDENSGKGLIIDDTKDKTNLSGLKLTYTPKKGTFKGTFKVYALEGSGKATKLKKYSVKVSGFVVDGVGHGTATCKKPKLSWTVEVRD